MDGPHPNIDRYAADDDHRNPGWSGVMLEMGLRDICLQLDRLNSNLETRDERDKLRDALQAGSDLVQEVFSASVHTNEWEHRALTWRHDIVIPLIGAKK